jgi:hypothetical protein
MADAPTKKPSLDEFVADLRGKLNVPSSIPDDQLLRIIFEERPDLIKRVQTSEPRQRIDPPPSLGTRVLDKAAGAIHEGLGPLAGGIAGASLGGPAGAALGGATGKQLQTVIDQMVGMKPPGLGQQIKQDVNEGAGQAAYEMGGQLIGKGVEAGLSAKEGYQAYRASKAAAKAEADMSKVSEAPLRNTKADSEALLGAKKMSAPVHKVINQAYTSVDKAMENQYVNANKLSADIAHARNVIKESSKVTGAKQLDVGGAKDTVSRLVNRVKGNRTMSWQDAKTSLQEIRAAKAKFDKVSAMYKSLDEIETGLEKVMGESADTMGQKASWEKVEADYKTISDWERRQARAIQGLYYEGGELSSVAKETPTTKAGKVMEIVKRRGRGRADIALQKRMLKASHAQLDAIHARVKAPPVDRPKGAVMGLQGESEMERARRNP